MRKSEGSEMLEGFDSAAAGFEDGESHMEGPEGYLANSQQK